MRESFWGTMILSFGVIAIIFIYFFQNITNTDQQNYNLLKETTEAAMFDSIDQTEYQKNGNIKINAEKLRMFDVDHREKQGPIKGPLVLIQTGPIDEKQGPIK